MSTLHLYTDDQGETHLAELDLKLAEYPLSRVTPKHEQSEPLEAARIVFFHFLAGTAGAWHTAPRRQYLLLQSGSLEITPSAGAAQTLVPGDLVLIEDTHGKGHLTRAIGADGARGVFVHLAGEPG